MRFIPNLLLAVVTTLGPLACARYEWVSDDELPGCAASRRPTSSAPFMLEQDSGAVSGILHGRVVVSGSRRPIPGSAVTLLTEPARMTMADSLGTFTFADVPAGTHPLRTRRIGYRSRTDTLHLPLTSGAALVLPLEPETFDGPCSGFAKVRVRKPWWKLW